MAFYTDKAMIKPVIPQGNLLAHRSGSGVAAPVKNATPFVHTLRQFGDAFVGASSEPGSDSRPQRVWRGAQEAAAFAYNRHSLKHGGPSGPARPTIDIYV